MLYLMPVLFSKRVPELKTSQSYDKTQRKHTYFADHITKGDWKAQIANN